MHEMRGQSIAIFLVLQWHCQEIANNEYKREPSLTNQEIVKKFIAGLNHEPFDGIGFAELDGLVIQTGPICFELPTVKITLREILAEDLKTEVHLHQAFSQFRYQHPISRSTSIIQIEMSTHEVEDIKIEINKTIVLLRLFRVGGINCLKEKIQFEPSENSPINDYPSELRNGWSRSYVINDSNINEFKVFFECLYSKIPEKSYDRFSTKKEEYLYLAMTAPRKLIQSKLENAIIT